jgi:hypothetical protein
MLVTEQFSPDAIGLHAKISERALANDFLSGMPRRL